MTYLAFLAAFLLPPILLVYAQLWRNHRFGVSKVDIRPALLLACVALIYTTPWDNYLVANRIWWYRTDWVIGATLGWVPVEEYAFFVLQTLLAAGWTLLLSQRQAPSIQSHPASRRLRWASGLAAGLGWLASIGVLLAGPPQWTYMSLILAWAVPPLALQLVFGADVLWQRGRALLLSIGLPTAYLILADALAIRTGTWIINPSLTLSTRVAGFPLEEALFFLVTNSLVVVGVTLWTSDDGRHRALVWLERLCLRTNAGARRSRGTISQTPAGVSRDQV